MFYIYLYLHIYKWGEKMKNKYLNMILSIFIIMFFLIANHIYHNIPEKVAIYSYKKNKTRESDLAIVIEVDRKELHLFNKKDSKIISSYPIASGKEDSPTPLGNFKIIYKDSWGEGFGSRWMGLNVPWGIYGIHGTNKPGSIGSNASAGCIRMLNTHIEELYEKVPVKTDVIIINGDYGPFGPGFRTLKPGDKGADVLEVQKRLKQRGFYSGEFDGIYGEGMKRALLDFLEKEEISLTDKIDEEIYKRLNIILID